MTTENRTTENRRDAEDLVTLAGRMGIPADEAMRQVAQLVADGDRPDAEARSEKGPARVPGARAPAPGVVRDRPSRTRRGRAELHRGRSA